MTVRLSIATNLTQSYLDEILLCVTAMGERAQEVEVFGSFPGYQNSLDRFFRKDISWDEFSSHVRAILLSGMHFNYLLNSLTLIPEKIGPEIEAIRSLGIRTVTVSREDAIAYLRDHYPDIEVVVSITYGAKDSHSLARLHTYANVKRIILDQSINHNFPVLIRLLQQAKDMGIEIELLSNELCYSDCSLRKKHYTSDSCYTKDGVNYGNICGIMQDPDIIFRSPWIRPEDMALYEKLGVSYLKIAGRNTPTSVLIHCLSAYLVRHYHGNFFNLMDLDGKREGVGGKEDLRHLTNAKLDGYLSRLLKSQRIGH